MSKENKNINKLDDFSNLIKQKLENHQLPVSDDIWAGIERKIAKPRRRINPWYWAVSGVAAVTALLLLAWPVQDTSQSARELAMETEVGLDKMLKPDVSAGKPASTPTDADFLTNLQAAPAVQKRTAGLSPQKNGGLSIYADKHIDTPVSCAVDETENHNTSAEIIVRDTENPNAETEATALSQSDEAVDKTAGTQSTAGKAEKIDRLPDLNDYPVISEKNKRTRKKHPLLLAAAFGTSGNNAGAAMEPKDFTSHMSSAPPRQLVCREIIDNYAGILTSEDYSDAEHQAPLSLGVILEKPLTERISVESGLVYTYLKSIYRTPGNVEKNGVLQLHYLGIPLNVKVKIIKQPKWALYTSAGGMVEKGLRSHYRQAIESMSVITNKEVKSNIDGLQWSLSGGAGLDYKFSKDLSLFVEPRITYYLENNQPMSARTEQPLNVGVNGGLRIEL